MSGPKVAFIVVAATLSLFAAVPWAVAGVYPADFTGSSYGSPSEIEWNFGDGSKDSDAIFWRISVGDPSGAITDQTWTLTGGDDGEGNLAPLVMYYLDTDFPKPLVIVNGASNSLIVNMDVQGSHGVEKLGDGLMALNRSCTYTGGTFIGGGTVQLGATGSMLLSADSAINVASDAALDLFGTFRLDLASLSGNNAIVSGSGTVTYESSFAVAAADGTPFTKSGSEWTYTNDQGTWTFDPATGSLAGVPEPSTLVLLVAAAALLSLGGVLRGRESL